MPPSAGACQTIDASVKPLCGRASQWSSTITAMTWRCAAPGDTGSPVSGAGMRTGVGRGVGVGPGVGVAFWAGAVAAGVGAAPAVGGALAEGGGAPLGVRGAGGGGGGPGDRAAG